MVTTPMRGAAKQPIAKPLKRSGAWFAQVALPGQIPRYVCDATGCAIRYPTAEAADQAAKAAFFEASVKRAAAVPQLGGYSKISAAEFCCELVSLDISPITFAQLYGTQPARVEEWRSGAREVPHAAGLLLRLLKHPMNMKASLDFSNEARREAA